MNINSIDFEKELRLSSRLERQLFEARERIAALETELSNKDREIECLLMDRDKEVQDLRKSLCASSSSMFGCENCQRVLKKWEKLQENFCQVPGILEKMIYRTDKLLKNKN